MLQTSFILISLLSLVLFYFGTGKNKRLILFFIGWQVIVGSISAKNIFIQYPILFPIVIIVTILLSVFCFRKIEKRKCNPIFLLSIHILRIPVELLLFLLFLEKKVPQTMTFSGWNFDILIGISTLLILLFSTKEKWKSTLFIFWNCIGIVFLMIIVLLAILSSPLPIQLFAFDQPNVAVLEFPYCFLPTCIVPLVMMSHGLLICISRQKDS